MPWYAKALLAINSILKAFLTVMVYRSGQKSAELKEDKRDLEAAERINEAHINSPAGKSDLIDRLRKPGGKL